MENCAFRPLKMYLEYLDSDQMRRSVEKTIWNIWRQINERQSRALTYSALNCAPRFAGHLILSIFWFLYLWILFWWLIMLSLFDQLCIGGGIKQQFPHILANINNFIPLDQLYPTANFTNLIAKTNIFIPIVQLPIANFLWLKF